MGGATGESGAAAALEAEIKRRGLVRQPVTADSQAIPEEASGFRGVTWREKTGRRGSGKWKWPSQWVCQIKVDGTAKHLGLFEPSARGEVDAALAHDAAARAAGKPEKANFLQPVRALPS